MRSLIHFYTLYLIFQTKVRLLMEKFREFDGQAQQNIDNLQVLAIDIWQHIYQTQKITWQGHVPS